MAWLKIVLLRYILIIAGVWFVSWFLKNLITHVIKHYFSYEERKNISSSEHHEDSSSCETTESQDFIEICPHCGYARLDRDHSDCGR